MVNLFIVQSPFQLLGAIEARSHFSTDKNILIIRYSLGSNDTQLEKLKSLSSWEKIIEIRPLFHPKIGNIQLLREITKFKKQKLFFNRIFIGEYRSAHMRRFFDILKPDECFLLDDGNITIDIQKNYLPFERTAYYNSGFKSTMVNFINFFIEAALGVLAPKSRLPINLFTCFGLSPYSEKQKVINHNFPFLKAQSQAKTYLPETIFFFGGNLSEVGFITKETEMAAMAEVKKYYENLNKKIVYIPHRKESESKILELQSKLDMEIRYFKNPAELEFVYMDIKPFGIASFFSTALFTVSRIFDFSSINAFYLAPEVIAPTYRQEVLETYNEYEKHFKVIGLNEIN